MLDRLKTLSNENAAKIMTDSGVSPTPPKRCTRDKATESHCTLRDVLSRADNATIDKLTDLQKKLMAEEFKAKKKYEDYLANISD